MKRIILILLSLTFFANAQYLPGTKGFLFPSSGGVGPLPPNLALQGFGKNAGGSDPGDPTITVTTTSAAHGVGTLWYAINTALGGTGSPVSHKKIVFSVSGTITSNEFTITDLDHVTIDGTGQTIVITAPANDGMSFEGQDAHHIIVKNIHFANSGGDGANVVDDGATGAHDIAFMNCSFYGNGDGNLDFAAESHDCTAQYNILGFGQAGWAGNMLITGDRISTHHNLYFPKTPGVAVGERNPMTHGNYANAFSDVRNNIVYNFGRNDATGSGYGSQVAYDATEGSSGCGCYGRSNIVNNYYYTTSAAADQNGVTVNGDPYSEPAGAGYSAGNVSGNGFNFNVAPYTNVPEWSTAGFSIGVETACEAVANVLTYVGPDTKNATDVALIAGVTNLGTCFINRLKSPVFTPYEGISYQSGDSTTFTTWGGLVADIPRRKKLKFKITI